jgi:hypothetical protein
LLVRVVIVMLPDPVLKPDDQPAEFEAPTVMIPSVGTAVLKLIVPVDNGLVDDTEMTIA